MNTEKVKMKKSTIIWLAAIISAVICIAALIIWLLSSFHIVGGKLYDKDEFFLVDGVAYSNGDYFELDGKAYDRTSYFELNGVAYDYASCFEFDGASYSKSDYFIAGDKVYDFETYFCLNDTAYAHADYFLLNDTAYAHADYFLLNDTAYDRAEWFEHDGTAYRHSEYYVAFDRLYEIKEISIGGKTFMSDVTELDLRDCGLKDISALADCGRLEYLDLGSDWTSGVNANCLEDISALSELYGLKYLDLSHNKLRYIDALAGLVNLEHLNLEYNTIHDLAPLAGMTKMTYLDLSNNEHGEGYDELYGPKAVFMSFSDYSAVSGMTELTYLDICNNYLDMVHQFKAMANLTKLQTLKAAGMIKIGGGDLTLEESRKVDLTPLGGMTQLTELWVIVWGDLSPLKNLTRLEKLIIHGGQFVDLEPISELTNLKYLTVYNVGILDAQPLANLTNLEFLRLGLVYICEELYDIYMTDNIIKDISFLSGMKNLEYLDIYDSHPRDYSPLYELKKLKCLRAPKGITADQLSTLRSIFSDCELMFEVDNSTSPTPEIWKEEWEFSYTNIL